MLDIDPPDHTRLRALVSRAFTPRSVSRWEGRVQEIADRLLDAVAGHDRFDLIKAGSRSHPARQTVGAAPTYCGRTVESAVWSYEDPIPGMIVIVGYLAFYRDRMDGWSEEDLPSG